MLVSFAMAVSGGLVSGWLVKQLGIAQETSLFVDRATFEVPTLEMPFYFDQRGEINRELMVELIARYPRQWAETSSHRFRHPKDMQYGFSFFYYLIHRGEKLVKPPVDEIWARELDVDGDGILNDNELVTLVSIANGPENPPTVAQVDEYKNCLQPVTKTHDVSRTTNATIYR